MRQYSSLILILTFILIGFGSCKKDTEITCNLNVADQAPINMTISFSATQTGDGTISTLTYKTSAGEETITNPSLPWTIDVTADEGTDISITAQGKVKDGSLTVSYLGESQGSVVEGSDFCTHSNN